MHAFTVYAKIRSLLGVLKNWQPPPLFLLLLYFYYYAIVLLLYTPIFDYLRCKRMHFVFIIADPITRKQYAGWHVSSAVVHSGITIFYYVSQFLRWAILSEAVKCGKAFSGYLGWGIH
ncbi:hypothetical protein BD408DRAFT_423589 [Parasitella parasitica]|nr:hypothetical protein BD408DRAFT_423589 [Parasitella parasitica]